MPGQTVKVTGLLAKLGARAQQAHEAHKNDTTTIGNPQLPAGINDGIAQLREFKFGEFKEGKNKGKPYFLVAGVVKEPKEFNGQDIEGLRTQIGPEALCDTPGVSGKRKTFDDHYAYLLATLRTLGVNTSETTFNNLEETALALARAQPHFRFRTWTSKPTPQFPNPRVNHDWTGLCEYNGQASATSAVEDNSAVPAADVVEEQVSEASAAGEASEAAGASADQTIEELVALADSDGTDAAETAARKQLKDMALALGLDEDLVANAADWAEVGGIIEAAQNADPSVLEEQEPAKPIVGNVYHYRIIDPATKKPAIDKKSKRPLKPVEVSCTAVDEAKKTVNIKNLDDGKTLYKGAKWTALLDKDGKPLF